LSIYNGSTSTLLKKGSSGPAVGLLEDLLRQPVSFKFDDALYVVVRAFQTRTRITIDGIVGPQTWKKAVETAHFRDLVCVKQVSLAPDSPVSGVTSVGKVWNKYGGLLDLVGDILSVDPLLLASVLVVESKGTPFGPDGRPIIRFENHLFWDRWGKTNSDKYSLHFMHGMDVNGKPRTDKVRWKGHFVRPDVLGSWIEMHPAGSLSISQKIEWDAFTIASSLNSEAAIKSTSFGLGQVLGSNFSQAGYLDQDEFVRDMSDEKLQALAMLEFIKNGSLMWDALTRKDFVTFAQVYNGPGQAITYGEMIRKNYEISKTVKN
jgi:hypothetical protein